MPNREWFVENRRFYMMFGDEDKPFYRMECECDDCETWRSAKGRPTHRELRAIDEVGVLS